MPNSPLLPWPIALSTGCFYRRPILDVLHVIRESGFRQIEVCSFPMHLDYHNDEAVEKAAAQFRILDVDPVSFHAPFADRIDITDPETGPRSRAVAELLKACEAAAHLGCSHVVLHPGPEREGRPPESEFLLRMEMAADSLNQVAERCCQLGITLLLENMLAHLMFGHVRDMMYLLGEIKTCAVGTCLDTGHAHLAGEMDHVIHKLSGHLKMVHVNDNHGHRDEHLIPGDGAIDWPRVISELQAHGFSGSLILEISSGDGEPVESVLARAQRGRAFLEQLMANPAQ